MMNIPLPKLNRAHGLIGAALFFLMAHFGCATAPSGNNVSPHSRANISSLSKKESEQARISHSQLEKELFNAGFNQSQIRQFLACGGTLEYLTEIKAINFGDYLDILDAKKAGIPVEHARELTSRGFRNYDILEFFQTPVYKKGQSDLIRVPTKVPIDYLITFLDSDYIECKDKPGTSIRGWRSRPDSSARIGIQKAYELGFEINKANTDYINRLYAVWEDNHIKTRAPLLQHLIGLMQCNCTPEDIRSCFDSGIYGSGEVLQIISDRKK